MFFNVRSAAFVALVLAAQVIAAPAPAPAPEVAQAAPPDPSSPAPPAPSSPAPPAPSSPPASPAPDAPAAKQDMASPAPKLQDGTAPPVEKIVKKLNCDSKYVRKGDAKVDGKPVNLAGNPGALTLNDKPVSLGFYECTSELMGYKADDKRHYGLVKPSIANDDRDNCLSAEVLAQKDIHLVLKPCSMSDDSSQFMQYWQYDAKDNSLNFLGRPSPSPIYAMNLKDDLVTVSNEGNSSVKLTIA